MDRNPDFGTFGRFEETPVDAMSPEMRDAYAFTKELRGLVPGPHKIWLANPALSKTVVPTGAYFQTRSPLTKAPRPPPPTTTTPAATARPTPPPTRWNA